MEGLFLFALSQQWELSRHFGAKTKIVKICWHFMVQKYRTGRCKGGQTVVQAGKFTGKQICKCLDIRIQAAGSTEVFGSYIQRFE
jgi:hypothetical protein